MYPWRKTASYKASNHLYNISHIILSPNKNNQSFEMAKIYDANTRETIDKETYAWEAISWV